MMIGYSCNRNCQSNFQCLVAAINTAVAAGKTGKRAKENSTYKLYIQGHSITTMSESNRNEQRSDKDANDGTTQVVYNQEQLRNITQLCHADHRYFGLTERRAFPFDLLVRSLCPSIVGHNAVKAGLLLCLLGGTPPLSQAVEKEQSIRCNSHILIVGDPGLGNYALHSRSQERINLKCISHCLLYRFIFQERVKCYLPRVNWRHEVCTSGETLRPRQG